MVNRVGSTFVHRMQEETGAAAPEVVRAYLAGARGVRLRRAVARHRSARQPGPRPHADRDDHRRRAPHRARHALVPAAPRSTSPTSPRSIEHFKAGAEARRGALPAGAAPDGPVRLYLGGGTAGEGPRAARARGARRRARRHVQRARHRRGRRPAEARRRRRGAACTSASRASSTSRGCASASASSRPTTTGRPSPRPRCATTSPACCAPSLPTPCAPETSPPGRRATRVLHERLKQILAELRAVESPDLAMLSVAMRELRNLASR